MIQRWVMIGDTPTTVTKALGTMPCVVPVGPNGEEHPTPLEARTARCSHPTDVLIGSAPTCAHHLDMVASLAGEDDYEYLTGGMFEAPSCARRQA